jgi:hypothetical protein
MVDARDFGVVGNGVADDTMALQSFLNFVSETQGQGVIPPGDYRITETLTIDSANHFKVQGLSQTGGMGNSGSFGVRILWDGAENGVPIRLINVRDAEISNLFIGVLSGKRILAGLDIDGDESTHNLFDNLMVDQYAGEMETGVRICSTAPTGCDLMVFRRLFVRGAGQGVWIIGSQSKAHAFEFSQFLGSGYGIRTTNGSFSLYHPNFSGNQVDIYIGEVSDAITIVAPMSEGARRFLVVRGAECAAMPITITGGRLTHDKLDLDGEYIQLMTAGPLNLLGVNFASGAYSSQWRIRGTNNCVYSGKVQKGVVVAIGSQFPNTQVFTGSHRLVLLGSLGINTVGGAIQISDKR